MSTVNNVITLTRTSDSASFTINAGGILDVYATGSGSTITYETYNRVIKSDVVTQSPSTIASASNNLISVTTSAGAHRINAAKVLEVVVNGTGSDILYDNTGTQIKYNVSETRASIISAILALANSGDGTVTTGITAHAGGGQALATQLAYGYSEITVCATTGDSVKLPVGVVSGKVVVLNDTAKSADVFPSTGGTINDGAANSAVPIAPGNEIIFECIDGTNWETSTQVIAAGNGTVALPSITFESDVDSGLYRIGANNIGVAANGAKVLDIATTGLGVTGGITASTTLTTGAGAVGSPSLVVGANDNGQYEVSATQQGFSIGNTLVGGYDSSGLFANIVSEQTAASGVTVDGLVIRDNRMEYNATGFFGVTKAADTTLTIDETGFIWGDKATTLTLTLPATVVGFSYFIVNINGGATILVSPDAADYIGGAGLTKVDDKDLIIPAVKGAYAQIIADGVNGWYIAQGSGTLTKEA